MYGVVDEFVYENERHEEGIHAAFQEDRRFASDIATVHDRRSQEAECGMISWVVYDTNCYHVGDAIIPMSPVKKKILDSAVVCDTLALWIRFSG